MDTRNQMSWSTWPAAAPPIPTATVPANPIQSSILPTSVNSAPSVLPPGLQYSPEQWAQAQQHNWQQWAQWQQQYQQWHQQYGAEYQKSLTAMQSTMPATQPPLPSLINTAVIPPLPENKPPLPPDEPPDSQASVMPSYSSLSTRPPRAGYSTMTMTQPPPTTQLAWQQKRPYGQESEYFQSKKPLLDQSGSQKEVSAVQTTFSQPPPQTPAKVNAEELSEAEKKFDKEFAAWEAQFQKWKEQNANHPDKTQYREYEKKWESWRNSLLERREQMRRKRLALSSGTSSAQQSTAVIKGPNFTQPPPNISQKLVSNVQQNVVPGPYTSLPPNQNNEPLAFNSEKSAAGENFLGTAPLTNVIPGLDLIKDDGKDTDKENKELLIKGPDLDAISKGITSILGDQKLLNMLSLVTKHPPPAPVQQKHEFIAQTPVGNFQDNQLGNLSLPPPTSIRDNFNDQSNQSFEDRSNQGDYHQREAVNNFDDQTRSSFTMGVSDPDHIYRNRGQSGRFGDERFGSGFGPSVARTNLLESSTPRSLLSLTFPPGGPKIIDDNYGPSGSMISENFGSSSSRNKFGQTRIDNFRQKGTENLNRFPQNNAYRNESFLSENRGNTFCQNGRFGNNYEKLEPGNFQNKDDHCEDHSGNISTVRGRSGLGNYNQEDDYDNYNDNEDYDKYHNIFNEDEQDYQEDNDYSYKNRQKDLKTKQTSSEFLTNQSIPSQEPFLTEPIASVPSQNQEVCTEESIFEPVKVIDYEHKSLHQADFEVTIEPIHMFDYRHRPLNRIPLPQRPKWLSESVKFIREFDPLATRVYERSQRDKIGRYPADPFERDRNHHDRGRREFNRNRGQYERDNGSHEADYSEYQTGLEEYSKGEGNEKNHQFRNKSDTYKGIKNPRLENDGKVENDNDFDSKHIDEKFDLRDNLEELSDEDMDWEADERSKLNNTSEEPINKSRSSSPILSNPPNPSNISQEIQVIEDIINPPGRFTRPPRIVIILRGPPGSGKTYLARLIKDKEVENGGSAPRILSLDDYFMIEQERNVVEDGKQITVKEMVYEYEAEMEDSYRASFVKSFKKTITDGYFPFIIVDNVNDKVKYFGEMWSFAKQNGFQVYVCQMDLDPVLCTKRNIHNRSETEIEECIAGWEPTPTHHPAIDATSFLQSNQIKEVEMEVSDEKMSQEETNIDETREDHVRSKWDTFDYSSNNLAKLDGVSKPLRKKETFEEYLQLERQWSTQRKPGQKRVRWADLEEQRELEKIKAIGFVVGHTDWDKIMDPASAANRALTQTKYI